MAEQSRNFERLEGPNKTNSATESIAGKASLREKRWSVCRPLAPHAAEASSSDASIEQKEAASIKKTSGDRKGIDGLVASW